QEVGPRVSLRNAEWGMRNWGRPTTKDQRPTPGRTIRNPRSEIRNSRRLPGGEGRGGGSGYPSPHGGPGGGPGFLEARAAPVGGAAGHLRPGNRPRPQDAYRRADGRGSQQVRPSDPAHEEPPGSIRPTNLFAAAPSLSSARRKRRAGGRTNPGGVLRMP